MKTKAVGTLEAKTRFSELLGQVERGWRFLITRRDRPVAELAPVRSGRQGPHPGFARGCFIHVADDFDAPLADFRDFSLMMGNSTPTGSTASGEAERRAVRPG